VNERLVLFDIDGTLLRSGLVSKRVFLHAIEAVFGRRISSDGYRFAGKTDPQIVQGLLELSGVGAADARAHLAEVFERYIVLLRAELAGEGRARLRLLPGVGELLGRLAAERWVSLGLLTGNIEPAARLKLGVFDLNRYFSIGAFGDDDADRGRLLPIARARAKDRLGICFAPEQIVVVGDTPEDIRCARTNGAVAVAVATGTVPAERLAECGPDHLFSSLEDVEGFVSAISGRPEGKAQEGDIDRCG